MDAKVLVLLSKSLNTAAQAPTSTPALPRIIRSSSRGSAHRRTAMPRMIVPAPSLAQQVLITTSSSAVSLLNK
uniref:Uncharacterized protein n=1 Tax=Picea sitchensis TaxID=3332 RepID=D5AEG7_PICSI|nr:unknown [Picea sitchensis]